MSSIRFYVLAALDRHGPMHGHALVALAEQEHVHEWTDISVGGLYGAARRLAADGLIERIRTEKHGNYPARQVFAITDAGRDSLRIMRRQLLTDFARTPDPVDLALWSLDRDTLDELPDIIRTRRTQIAARIEAKHAHRATIRKFLTQAEWAATSHDVHRLQAELAWHDELLAALPDIIRDERSRTKEQP